jgi:PmbA protein
MNKTERLNLAEWAMQDALKHGADEAAVRVTNRREIEIAFRDRRLEKLKESVQNRLHVEIYSDQRFSVQSTNDLRRDTLSNFIEQAVGSTRRLTIDEYRSLPDPKYYPADLESDLEIFDETYNEVEPQDRVRLASDIEASAMAQSDRIISATSGYVDVYYEAARVHSNGFAGEVTSTSFEAGAEVTVKDKNGGRPEDWAWAHTRFHKDLTTAQKLGTEAATRALHKIGQRKIGSGRYDMIVENRVGRRLLYMLLRPMSASALQQKNSFLEGMLGERIASDKFTLIDDPTLRKGLGSRLFDWEGLAAKRRVMIEKGILRHYYVDNYYGRKLRMEPTTGGTSNLIFEYGTKLPEEMIGETGKVILVQGFIGGNSNSTTGDFSVGIFGLLFENGELVRPVNEMNIAGNAKDFWNRLVATGNDPYPYSAHRVPSMFFESVDFSGI